MVLCRVETRPPPLPEAKGLGLAEILEHGYEGFSGA